MGQLAAGVAHEINNPIAFVGANLNTLRHYADELLRRIAGDDAGGPQALAELREDLPVLLDECADGLGRVRKIVQDLKDFSRVDQADWQEADLNAGLESTLNVLRHELKYKARVERRLGVLPPVRCLPGQLNQVFMNLVVNASQALGEAGTVTLSSGTEGPWAWVQVDDDGCGMPEAVRRRIFEPFFTTKDVGKGTGLGLSLSFSIVKKHGGAIQVRSAPGAGSSFRVWVPVGGPGAVAGQAVPAAWQDAPGPGPGPGLAVCAAAPGPRPDRGRPAALRRRAAGRRARRGRRPPRTRSSRRGRRARGGRVRRPAPRAVRAVPGRRARPAPGSPSRARSASGRRGARAGARPVGVAAAEQGLARGTLGARVRAAQCPVDAEHGGPAVRPQRLVPAVDHVVPRGRRARPDARRLQPIAERRSHAPRQPAVALGPGEQAGLVVAAVFARRMEAVAAGEVVQAGPGRDPGGAGAIVVAAAVVQVPAQRRRMQALGVQPAVEGLGVERGQGLVPAGAARVRPAAARPPAAAAPRARRAPRRRGRCTGAPAGCGRGGARRRRGGPRRAAPGRARPAARATPRRAGRAAAGNGRRAGRPCRPSRGRGRPRPGPSARPARRPPPPSRGARRVAHPPRHAARPPAPAAAAGTARRPARSGRGR
ncbi:sensor histidine kinase [Piscinibacter sakaiensis]|uniref:sensor histidine kinase n=1 Tax=Piscinibacter sakaiensis TaxID=1547922 RepID=UPI00372D5F28